MVYITNQLRRGFFVLMVQNAFSYGTIKKLWKHING